MVYVKAERKHTRRSRLVIGDRGRVKSVEPAATTATTSSSTASCQPRASAAHHRAATQSADYLDLFEAIEGDFERIDVCSYEFKGMAIGIFNEETYYKRSVEMLDMSIYDQLFMKDRPIRTKAHDAPPAKYYAGSNATNSLISAGCEIRARCAGRFSLAASSSRAVRT